MDTIGIKLYLWLNNLREWINKSMRRCVGRINSKKIKYNFGSVRLSPLLLQLTCCVTPDDVYELCGIDCYSLDFRYHSYGINPDTYNNVTNILLSNAMCKSNNIAPHEVRYLWANYSPIDVNNAEKWRIYYYKMGDIRHICDKFSDGFYFK